MLQYKCALFILPITFIFSVCSQFVLETNSLITGLACFYVTSGAVVGKIIFDRNQQTNVISSLTTNPNVTYFTNRISSFSALFLLLGFLVYIFLYLFKVNNFSLIALNIFMCGFGTLYIWTQCIVTSYTSTLYYYRKLSTLRKCLANLSFLLLIIMAVFGTVASFLPRGSSGGINFCLIITTTMSYALAAIFSMFILTFEKEHSYFSEGLQSELLLDDGCSLNGSSFTDENNIMGREAIITCNTVFMKANNRCMKKS